MAANNTSRHYNWCFTINNWRQEDIDHLKSMKYKYLLFGREIAPTTGTRHLQGVIRMKSNKTFAQMQNNNMVPGAHLEVCRSMEDSIEYCKKDGDYEEYGSIPVSKKEQGQMEKDRWALALEQAKTSGEVEDPQIAFIHARTISYIFDQELRKRQLVDTDAEHEWYWGASGTGKSYTARTKYPGAYLKMCNRWWDGYVDEEFVIIEDFDTGHNGLCHHMKIWSDRYEFNAEKKGSTVKIRPKKIIVTSNYHPSSIWSSPEDIEPILRRFKVTEFKLLDGQKFVPPPPPPPSPPPTTTLVDDDDDDESTLILPTLPENFYDEVTEITPAQREEE